MVLKVEFEKKFEHKFRELAMRKYGFSKGSIKKASEEAINLWIRLEDRGLPSSKDPFESLRGCIKHLRGKYTSVDLQHEAVKLWTKEK